MTLKQLKGNGLDYILFDPVSRFDNCCNLGLQLEQFENFPEYDLILYISPEFCLDTSQTLVQSVADKTNRIESKTTQLSLKF